MPLLLIYFILYPFVKFRFLRLIGSAIGHYSSNTELLLAKLSTLKDDEFINIFYLEHTLCEPTSICNLQLHQMWKRTLLMLPLRCFSIVERLDQLIMCFLGNRAYGLNGDKKYLRARAIGTRDRNGYFKATPTTLSFTPEEHQRAKEMLGRVNITLNTPYVCLLVRSSAYNKNHPDWHCPERNAEISTYMKAAHFLAEKGYYVFRMGKVVEDNLPISHPRIFDYATSPIRCDFMDVYLTAYCLFFITTGTGLDGVAEIFRKPILYTNAFVLPLVATWYPHRLFTFKRVMFKDSNTPLTLKELVYYFHSHPDYVSRATFSVADYMEKLKLQFIDNTEDELHDAVEEMEARVTGAWKEYTEDLLLQEKFWSMFPKDAVYVKPYHGTIDTKLSARFLSKYQHLLF